jgi:hypothetical protein
MTFRKGAFFCLLIAHVLQYISFPPSSSFQEQSPWKEYPAELQLSVKCSSTQTMTEQQNSYSTLFTSQRQPQAPGGHIREGNKLAHC